jgi:hypothetical protein
MRSIWMALSLALLAVATPVRAADNVPLTKGLLFQSGSYAIQTVGALNQTGQAIEYLEVQCGFFRHGELVRSGEGVAQNIKLGQRAYFDVRSSDTPDADSTECRISDVKPSETSSDAPQVVAPAPPSWDQIAALRAATMTLLTVTAIDLAKASGKPPQLFLDALEKASADAIRTADINGSDEPVALRQAVQDRLKELFTGIRF